jgi:sugar/nucleoside kinase (ribokinase family)
VKILGIGQSVIDEISVVTAGGKIVPGDCDAGGPVLVALIMLAKLGGDCTFISTVGRDQAGRYIQDLLADHGITLHERTHAQTRVNTILVDELTGQREKTQSTLTHPSIAGLEPAFLRSFDMIIMDRHEPEAFQEVIRHKRPDAQLVTDPSTELSQHTLDMLRKADRPVATIGMLARLGSDTITEAARTLHEICGKPLVVTLGEFGSLTYDGNAVRIIPAFDVNVVNDLGAGDVYRGAFAYGQMLGWSLDQCIRYGSAAAALQCTKMGNAASVPSGHDIKAVITRGSYRPLDMDRLESTFQALLNQGILV